MAAPSPPTTIADASSDKNENTPKFYKGQRVFAKDENCGLLYEAVIRRAMYGVDRQDKTQEKEEEWHCFVHYLGWNVKWDRWVSEGSIYEMTDKNRELANQLQKAVSDAKKKHGRKSPQVMVELIQTMKRLEQERRLEERREELARQGIVMQEQDKQNGQEAEQTSTKNNNKFNKAYFTKELALREQDLQGKRKQSYAEKLVLPFSLKKVLVEEYEVITQCGMVPTLPAKEGTTVQEVLDSYLATKITTPANGDLKSNEPSDEMVFDKINEAGSKEATNETLNAAEAETTSESQEQDELVRKQEQEWKEMVDGIALLFDQAIGAHLLYRQELSLHERVQQHPDYGNRRHSQVYGCEHLLRLFVRLPALLADKLSDTESRPIFSKLGDLVRYLQKHQSKIFLQSYRTPIVDEPSRKRASNGANKQTAKRKRTVSAQKETTQDDESMIAATIEEPLALPERNGEETLAATVPVDASCAVESN